MSEVFHRPPAEQWPVLGGPDCPTCQRWTEVTFIAPTTTLDGTDLNTWHCRACRTDWAIPITRWPVLDGPGCPTCHSTATCWAALDPDQGGDLWLCEHGHEFVLTPEGLIILPEDTQ
ncbi:hypothetical protein Acsp03_70760 [Actinomadura sp. NBRC 104412]|uniref:hypothetical protein n=1 Tax=Actinomadura sp. NBRC 104412 TaxID=3032203 RepID=UPI0024A57DD6|nr:hypothetical protein [Actinomadura sp. NBRC 104412]GLZ09610.1 hypothetical protein Acsp03_70760 [Actinomadura sp. NBRC 104412]